MSWWATLARGETRERAAEPALASAPTAGFAGKTVIDRSIDSETNQQCDDDTLELSGASALLRAFKGVL